MLAGQRYGLSREVVLFVADDRRRIARRQGCRDVSVVVDVSVVSASVVVSVPMDSVEVSVVVESESAANGPAPETTPADTRPAANSVTMTNET